MTRRKPIARTYVESVSVLVAGNDGSRRARQTYEGEPYDGLDAGHGGLRRWG